MEAMAARSRVPVSAKVRWEECGPLQKTPECRIALLASYGKEGERMAMMETAYWLDGGCYHGSADANAPLLAADTQPRETRQASVRDKRVEDTASAF